MEEMTDNITTYLEKVELHKQVLFRIKPDGSTVYVVHGIEFSKEEWEATNPPPTYKRPSRENVDSTTSWMTD